MANNQDYIPAKIADFHDFAANLIQVLTLHLPGTAKPWGYSGADYNSLVTDVDAFNAAYAIANPAGKKKSRSSAEVENMQEKRAFASAHIRAFVKQWLAYNPLVTNPDKMDLELTVFDTIRTRASIPATHPIVTSIKFDESLTHRISFRDETATGKAKPNGYAYCEIVYIVRMADSPPDSEDDCVLRIAPTHTPGKVYFNAADAGKTAFYFLRWYNTIGQAGPFSGMYHAVIV